MSMTDSGLASRRSVPIMETAGSPPPYSNRATPTVTSNAPSSTADSSSITPFKHHLMNILGIPDHLSNRADRNLHFAYQKYKAYIQACQTLSKRISDGTWPGKKPSGTDLIEIFLSKSMWFSHYKPAFSKVSNYPLMVEWLENEEEKPSDLDAWGIEKAMYTLTDLRKFVDNGTLAEEPVQKNKVEKGKGKKKVKDVCLTEEFRKGSKVVDKGSPKKKDVMSKKKNVVSKKKLQK